MTVKAGMVENGVVNYDGLNGMVLQTGENGHTEVWLGIDLGVAYAVESVDDVKWIAQGRIEEGKKPAGVLGKAVNRIYLHRAQLSDALTTLFATHEGMIAPKKESSGRKSAVWKARYSLLNDMPHKYLKEYATKYLPNEVDDYILTDKADKEALVTKLTTILAEEKESEDTEETVDITV